MPTIPPNENSRVLVTGANGYVAAWVVQTLLNQGYTVLGTVRSHEKGEQLKKAFDSYADRFEYVTVDDFTKVDREMVKSSVDLWLLISKGKEVYTLDGAFDEIVKDVDAIEHVASPVIGSHTKADEDPHNHIEPAVKGTLGILESALKYGERIKRVVITSSVATILRPLDAPTVLDENDWGDEWVKIVEKDGKHTPPLYKYFVSKLLAERAAWEFYNRRKSELGWELVVIHPSHVLGPPLLDFKFAGSLEVWYDYITKDQPDEILRSSYNYIDVRDLAGAHVESLKREAAGGERIIVSGGRSVWQETRDLLFTLKPQHYTSGSLPRGKPGLTPEVRIILNTGKASRILEIPYRSIQEITLDTLAEFETRKLLA